MMRKLIAALGFTAALVVVPLTAHAVVCGTSVTWLNNSPTTTAFGANNASSLDFACLVITDPTTPTQALAIDSGGHIGVTESGTWTVGLGAGSNTIGKVDVLGNAGGTLDTASGTGASTGLGIQGLSAAAATDTDVPLNVGARAATTNPTAVTDGQKVALMATSLGKLVNIPYTPSALANNNHGSTTSTTAITVMSASGSASLKEYMTDLHCGRSDAGTTAITLAISDGTTTITEVLPDAGSGGQANFRFSIPVVWAANTAVTVAPSSGVTTLYCDAEGFNAP